jgi:3-phenylpropionate/trans-cinnamate dioxygenase ferredoxin reductase subunit
MTRKVVIAGAGHAAGQVVATLRQKQFDGHVVLIGEERWLPYQRPPLSKKYLAGELPAERLFFKPPGFYEDPAIEVRPSTVVTAIDRDAQNVETSAGDTFDYDALVLAIGSHARTLNIDGENLAGVHYLRCLPAGP